LNAQYFSIDKFDSKWRHDGNLYDVFNNNEWSEGQWDKDYDKMRIKMMNEIKAMAKKGIVLVDGLQILTSYTDELYGKHWKCKYCFIDMGTSMIKAAYRGFKRDPKHAVKRPIATIKHFFFGTNRDIEKQLKNFRIELKQCGVSISSIGELI